MDDPEAFSACRVCVVDVIGEGKFVGRLEAFGKMVELAWSAGVEAVDRVIRLS